MIPLSRFARMLHVDRQTDRQTDHSALRSIAAHCGTLQNAYCSALQKHCRTLLYHCGVLWTIMVHCSELLWKHCGRLANHCGALGCMRCMYHTLQWSCITYMPPCNNSGTLWKCYRKLRDHWNACGPLWCLVVHCMDHTFRSPNPKPITNWILNFPHHYMRHRMYPSLTENVNLQSSH